MSKIALFAGLVAIAASASAFAQTATSPAAVPQAAAKPAATAPAATTAAPAKSDDAARTKFRAACGADITKHCGDIKPIANATAEQMKESRTKMRACLASHKADLSKDCPAVIDERAAAKKS